MQIQEVQSRQQASREEKIQGMDIVSTTLGSEGTNYDRTTAKLWKVTATGAVFFQHNMRFSGQQGPESLIIGAKDVPNADLGKKQEVFWSTGA